MRRNLKRGKRDVSGLMKDPDGKVDDMILAIDLIISSAPTSSMLNSALDARLLCVASY